MIKVYDKLMPLYYMHYHSLPFENRDFILNNIRVINDIKFNINSAVVTKSYD